jgi:hypothetical protein
VVKARRPDSRRGRPEGGLDSGGLGPAFPAGPLPGGPAGRIVRIGQVVRVVRAGGGNGRAASGAWIP